jgi:hypothetical protein
MLQIAGIAQNSRQEQGGDATAYFYLMEIKIIKNYLRNG